MCALIARRVRFVLVGGHAVAGHGEPRLTEDLDVFVEPSLANARKLREALADFGVRRRSDIARARVSRAPDATPHTRARTRAGSPDSRS